MHYSPKLLFPPFRREALENISAESSFFLTLALYFQRCSVQRFDNPYNPCPIGYGFPLSDRILSSAIQNELLWAEDGWEFPGGVWNVGPLPLDPQAENDFFELITQEPNLEGVVLQADDYFEITMRTAVDRKVTPFIENLGQVVRGGSIHEYFRLFYYDGEGNLVEWVRQ